MRRPFTTAEAFKAGISKSALAWGVKTGRWVKAEHGVYLHGSEPPALLETALARVVVTDGVASGMLAGALHCLDGITNAYESATVDPSRNSHRAGVRSGSIEPVQVVAIDGYKCTDGTRTMIDLARDLGDDRWEQALECALRKGLTTVALLESELERLRPKRVWGIRTARRVLARRAAGAPPTGSLLETLAIQLIRNETNLPEPQRQIEVVDEFGQFRGIVDLAWTDVGLFLELDGQQHKDQPVYDARRETAIVATTGWLPGRFTWREITKLRRSTGRRIMALYSQASHLSRD